MRFITTVLLLAVAVLVAPAVSAGTISIGWDPVTDADLVGYRIYWGTAPGSYTQQQDVGIVTTATLSGLTDCTTYYVGVKARDAAGNLSPSYSNEIVGFPRPVVSSASPTSAEQGLPTSIVITGANFVNGATVQFGNPAITVSSVTVTSCTQLTANVTVGAGAALGATSIDVTNPDRVFGTAPGLFAIVAAIAPTVVSVAPVSLATGVPLSVHPTLTFSEAMKAATITASTVVLLDGTSAVAQAPGSPSLSADGKTATIVPASPLANSRTYRLQVVGGTVGVKDLANNAMLSTWTQASGFTTVNDTSDPTISAVSASAQATTATITWTTDESTDSRVFYRKSTDVVYQQSPVDTNLVTSHSVQLQGLAPSTQYLFYVESSDGAGNSATSSPDVPFTTSASSYTYITIDAESGTLSTPARATSGAGAFRGAWIDTPAGTAAGTTTAPSGKADLGFHVPAAGTWYLWVRLYGATTSSDAWFESVDGATRQQIAPSAVGQWKWTAGRTYALNPGLHNLELGGKEAQARADRVVITNDPAFVPTEQPADDVTPPTVPSGLAATPGAAQIALDWTNPGSDVVSVVVRYRTDGRYPTSPADGFPVVSRSATPGAPESFVHTGLVNGTSYEYGVFAVDAAGNASAAAQVQATPVDDQPPPTVGSAWRTDKH